jgi:hypothetical protein
MCVSLSLYLSICLKVTGLCLIDRRADRDEENELVMIRSDADLAEFFHMVWDWCCARSSIQAHEWITLSFTADLPVEPRFTCLPFLALREYFYAASGCGRCQLICVLCTAAAAKSRFR